MAQRFMTKEEGDAIAALWVDVKCYAESTVCLTRMEQYHALCCLWERHNRPCPT